MKETHFGSVWVIPGKNRGKYPYCHSIYIEGAGILIDPSSDRQRLEQLRKEPSVNAIWLSHWHEDHIMDLDLFDDLPLYMSESDAPPLSDLELFMDAYGMGDKKIRELWRKIMLEQFHFKPRRPAGFLRGGEIVDLGTVNVEIIACPGHTAGHLAFFFREPAVLFAGDYDLSDFGPWYGDVESSIEQTIESVERLRRIPAATWVTAHNTGLFEKDPGERWDRYLGVIQDREEKLLNLLEEPKSLKDIVKAGIIYGAARKQTEFFAFGEKALMNKHLERLMKQGLIEEKGGYYYKV